MKSLEEILGNDKDVWFDIEKEDWKSFLKFAKESGCKWMEVKLTWKGILVLIIWALQKNVN